MNSAIKGLAWYTALMATMLMVLMGIQIGMTVVFTPQISALNITLMLPILALAILVLIRIKRRE